MLYICRITSGPCKTTRSKWIPFSGSPLPPSHCVPPRSFFLFVFLGWGGVGGLGRHRGEAGNLYYYIQEILNHFFYLNTLCLDVPTDSAWNSRADCWSQPVCLWHSLLLLCLLWPGGWVGLDHILVTNITTLYLPSFSSWCICFKLHCHSPLYNHIFSVYYIMYSGWYILLCCSLGPFSFYQTSLIFHLW